MLNFKLDKEDFNNWLKSKKDDEVVGYKDSCCGCPIVKFLTSKYPPADLNDMWLVNGISAYFANSESNKLKLPEWSKDFIRQIDDYDKGSHKKYVDKQDCLSVLWNLNKLSNEEKKIDESKLFLYTKRSYSYESIT